MGVEEVPSDEAGGDLNDASVQELIELNSRVSEHIPGHF